MSALWSGVVSGPVRGGALIVGALLSGALVFGAMPVDAQDAEPFPHAAHAGLFPVCTGCHTGVPAGDRSAFYPDSAGCVGCHDGVDYPVVAWSGPTPLRSNLAYEHATHAQDVAATGDPALACASCHVEAGGVRMAVVPLTAGTCLTCHGDDPADHLERDDCVTCHVPLAESTLPPARLSVLPRPLEHGADDYLSEVHGAQVAASAAACATCHVREQCTDCHVDAARPELAGLPTGHPDFGAPRLPARYPVPASHGEASFRAGHGSGLDDAASGLLDCGTCHVQEDCASCHLAPLPPAAAALPAQPEASAPGVRISVAAPRSHEWPLFSESHQAQAVADPASCATCHSEPFCVGCHQQPAPTGFHPDAFVLQHAAAAWSANTECANCHQTQVFCRSCHIESGITGQGRPGTGYHDAEPLFLLRHGQAARQALESCASCHRQTDCVQCHSTLGGFRVNPHGPGFDPKRISDRNSAICAACHLSWPGGG